MKTKIIESRIATLANKMQDVSHGGWVDCMDLLESLRGENEGPTGNPLERVTSAEAETRYRELVSQFESANNE